MLYCCCVLAAKFEVEGVDMLLFNDEGKISTLVQFDMQVRQLPGSRVHLSLGVWHWWCLRGGGVCWGWDWA